MNKKEERAYARFCKKHSHDGAGNNVQLFFTNTGIGTVYKVTCPICGETKDITDYGSW